MASASSAHTHTHNTIRIHDWKRRIVLPELDYVKEWGEPLEFQVAIQFPIRTAMKLLDSRRSRRNSSSWFFCHREFIISSFFLLCCMLMLVTNVYVLYNNKKSMTRHRLFLSVNQSGQSADSCNTIIEGANKYILYSKKRGKKECPLPFEKKKWKQAQKMYQIILDNVSLLATCLWTAFIHPVEWLIHSFSFMVTIISILWFILICLAFLRVYLYVYDLFSHQHIIPIRVYFTFSIILESSYSLYDRAFADNIGTVLFYAVIVSLWSFIFVLLFFYRYSR